MNGPAVSGAARPVGRGTNQRMTEPHRRTELDQPFFLGRCFGLSPDPELLGGAPQQGRIAQGFGGGDQQESLRLFRERPDAPEEAVLDLARQRQRPGKCEATCQLGRGQATGQLQQGERVAAGLGDDPVAHPLVEPPETRRVQQRPSITVAQATDRPFRQPLQLRCVARLADGEHQRDGLGQQPPRDEREGLRRDPVQPLCVVDQADERSLLGQRPTTDSAPPNPPGSDRPPRRRPARTPCRGRRVADPADPPCGPTSARTADAPQRTRAPSPIPRRPPERRDTRSRPSPRSPSRRSCRPPPHLGEPAPGSDGRERRSAADPAPRIRCTGRPARTPDQG